MTQSIKIEHPSPYGFHGRDDPEAVVTLDKECSISEWILHVDGSSNVKRNGVVVYLKPLIGEAIKQSFHMGFKASNNEVDYEDMIIGL